MASLSHELRPRQVASGGHHNILFNVAPFYPHLTPSRDNPDNLRERKIGRKQAASSGGKFVAGQKIKVQVRTGLDRATFRALVRSLNANPAYRREGRAR